MCLIRTRVVFCVAASLALLPPLRGAPSPNTATSVAVLPAVPGAPRIVFAGRPLPITDPALAPYRDPTDNVVCVAPESLAPLAIAHTVDTKNQTVQLIGPEHQNKTLRQRLSAGGRTFVPLVEAMEAMGGKCQWDAATNIVYIRALLTSVELLGGQLRIKATLPVAATVVNRKKPAQVIVDVLGAEVGKLPRKLSLHAPNLDGARTGQFTNDTARVVLDLNTAGAYAPPPPQPSTLLILNPLPTATTAPPIVIQIPADSSFPGTSVPPAFPSKLVPATVNAITLRRLDDKRAQIVVSADRAPEVRAALTQNRLTLDLLGTVLAGEVASKLGDLRHPLLQAVQVVAHGADTSRLIVDLTRVVAYSISPVASPAGLVIELALPRSAGGKLKGKLVVVDAGHGDQDGGALGVNRAREKNVNLAIALELRNQLREAGANVLMTRSDDTFVPLLERSLRANQARADFFISVHADSVRNRSVAGSTVYYHKQIGSCRALAQTIAERFAAMGGIGTKGIRSDRVLYTNGLSVLRNAQMVSVLVECGYMTNSGDAARLVQPAMQRKIAGAIADGLRDYIEGHPGQNTKNVNPLLVEPSVPLGLGTDALPTLDGPPVPDPAFPNP